MALLDTLLNGTTLDDLSSLMKENPQILQAAASLLDSGDSSVGEGFGLEDVIGALKGGGLERVVSSWLGSGQNQGIDGSQLEKALGPDVLGQFASRAGVGEAQAGSVLASVLPQLVNQLSPRGAAPDSGSLGGLLGGVMSSLQR